MKNHEQPNLRRILNPLFCCFLFAATNTAAAETPSALADPTIDTQRPRFDYFTSAGVPFGLVALNPDTRHGNLWDAGYRYYDEHILNFSHVHNAQTAGIPVMITTGSCRGHLGLHENRSRFRHDRETIRLGYHQVELLDFGVTVELTASTRAGFHRYTLPAAREAHVLFDLGAPLGPVKMQTAHVRRVSDRELEGGCVNASTLRRKNPCAVYFVARFDQPFDAFGGWQPDGSNPKHKTLIAPGVAGEISGPDSGGYVTFRVSSNGRKILMKVGVSFVSTKQARRNLDAEIADWDFDAAAARATEQWNRFLGRIELKGGTREQRIKFYTDLMHTASQRSSDCCVLPQA